MKAASRIFVIVALGLLAGNVSQAATTFFSIKANNKILGYSKFDSSVRKDRATIDSITVLKFALLGKDRVTRLESTTSFDAESGLPVAYHTKNTTNQLTEIIDCQFTGKAVKTWKHRPDDPRGEPTEQELPAETAILGGNNFGHWDHLLRSALPESGDTATVSVFVPEVGVVQTFAFRRAKGADTIALSDGNERKCEHWELPTAGLKVTVDANSHALLRMEIPAQQTTVELADQGIIKLAEKAKAEEVLKRHFTKSNVIFDDFLAVRELTAKVDVTAIGAGIDNQIEILTTPMQTFEGNKEAEKIRGTVTIVSKTFAAETSPPFPSKSPAKSMYLGPTTYIECDHPDIVQQAKKLSQGAITRWDVVQKVARWVHQEITYTIADSPSARLALETRSGDCGPHSTLTIAMLRAVGIPSRLVGGLVYTPSFGGSFGQHAWVEVDMGDQWVAIDPTTGEVEELSATHIKLFEGLGGVLPHAVTVEDYRPPNSASPVVVAKAPRPLPWTLDESFAYMYRQGEKELGRETFVFRRGGQGEAADIELECELDLKLNFVMSVKGTAKLVADPRGIPRSFERDMSALLQKVKIRCDFEDGKVVEKISGSKNLSTEVELPQSTYCFDNNMISSFALIFSQLELTVGEPMKVQTFHPSSMQLMALTVTPVERTTLELNGRQLECTECEVAPIQSKFWVADDGRLIKSTQGPIEIVLAKEE